jgi:REP-associated tyrosine transposase
VPRALRQHVPAGYYHVTTLGIEPIFLDDHDRTWFVTLLMRAPWECLAYCLMTNHYHLVLYVSDGVLSRAMQRLNGLYAQAFNNRRNRRGHLFAGRYRLTYIETEEHLAEACRYVVCNPVRADLCEHPRDWTWSSYRATVDGGWPRLELFASIDDYVAYVDEALLDKRGSDPRGV